MMPSSPPVDRLANLRQITLILRLVIDRRGRVMHGEIIDAEYQSQRRFKGWKGLLSSLREWLANGSPDSQKEDS